MVRFLRAQPFGSDLDFTFIRDDRITGNFECPLVETGELLYSGRRNGVLKEDVKRHEMAVRIEDALDALDG